MPIFYRGWRLVKVLPDTHAELNMSSYGGVSDLTVEEFNEMSGEVFPKPAEPADLLATIATKLDTAQYGALRAIKGYPRSWVGTTWNGMYNGLAGYGLCVVRRQPGGTKTSPKYRARITKLGTRLLEKYP